MLTYKGIRLSNLFNSYHLSCRLLDSFYHNTPTPTQELTTTILITPMRLIQQQSNLPFAQFLFRLNLYY